MLAESAGHKCHLVRVVGGYAKWDLLGENSTASNKKAGDIDVAAQQSRVCGTTQGTGIVVLKHLASDVPGV